MKTVTLAIMLLLHPVHVSLTGIDYDSEKKVYSVFIQVYSDDLEADMRLDSSGGSVIVDEKNEKFSEYLSDRILIFEDEEKLEMKLIKTESDGMEHRFSLVANGRRTVKNVTVVNRIMTRLYSDQANMLLFSFNGIEEGYKFTAGDTLKSYYVK